MIDNINVHNYDEAQMKQRQDFIPTVKANVLKRLKDLTEKIETEEAFPHGNMDLDTLCDIDGRLDNILRGWYY